MTRRAVSPVLGLALLVGLVAAATISLFLITTAFTANTKASIDHQQAEESLGTLAGEATAVAKGNADEGSYELTGAQDGTIRAIPDDGDRINVTVLDENDDRVFAIERELGSVVYDSPDGSQVAFQGGGVWRLQDAEHASMLSAPPIHYRESDEATLTLPVMLVRDEFIANERAAGTLVADERKRHYPDEPSHYNPLENGSVIVDVESIYCDGWEYYFKHRTDGSVTEGCDSRGVTDESEVRLVLSVPFTLDGLETGAAFDGEVDADNINDTAGSYADGGHSLQSPTRMITSRIDDCEEGEGTYLNGNETIEGPGLYCAEDDEMTGPKEYEINATEGDVEIAVDGDVFDSLNGDDSGLEIEGEGDVTLYVNGDILTGNGESGGIGNESDPSQLRVFVASGNSVGDRGHIGEVHALIYAPTSDVHFGGNSELHGGLVAEDADFQGGNEYVHVDDRVKDISVSFQPADAEIYFLHVSETEFVFEGPRS